MKNQKWIVLLIMVAMSTVGFSQRGVLDCPTPEHTKISQVTTESATLNWAPGEGTTSWVIEVGQVGFTPGSGIHTNLYNFTLMGETPYVSKKLTGLNNNFQYEAYIQTDCGEGGNSEWMGPYSFLTGNRPISAKSKKR